MPEPHAKKWHHLWQTHEWMTEDYNMISKRMKDRSSVCDLSISTVLKFHINLKYCFSCFFGESTLTLTSHHATHMLTWTSSKQTEGFWEVREQIHPAVALVISVKPCSKFLLHHEDVYNMSSHCSKASTVCTVAAAIKTYQTSALTLSVLLIIASGSSFFILLGVLYSSKDTGTYFLHILKQVDSALWHISLSCFSWM